MEKDFSDCDDDDQKESKPPMIMVHYGEDAINFLLDRARRIVDQVKKERALQAEPPHHRSSEN